MPFENRFITAQRGPTTYRFLGGDLKTAKNKVQAKNVSAKVPTPAPIKSKTERPDTGFGEGNDGRAGAPGQTPRDFARKSTLSELDARLSTGTFSGTSGVFDPSGLVGGMLGRALQYAAYEGRQREVDQSVRDERAAFEGRANQRASQQAAARAAMTQATKAPTQNISTGAQRGGGDGVEAGIRGPGGRGSESFGPSGRGSTGGGRSGGFDNGGFSRDRDFGGWT